MSAVEPTKTAVYKDQPVRVYIIGGDVHIDHNDLNAVTGRAWGPRIGLHPELDSTILDIKSQMPNFTEFAEWLNDEFGDLTLIDRTYPDNIRTE